jgi:hypothetical protein
MYFRETSQCPPVTELNWAVDVVQNFAEEPPSGGGGYLEAQLENVGNNIIVYCMSLLYQRIARAILPVIWQPSGNFPETRAEIIAKMKTRGLTRGKM